MRASLYIVLFLNLLLFGLTQQADCQFIPSGLVEEKIVLIADRNMYVVDENIQFKAGYLSNRNLEDLTWSRVLYVELISSDGTSYLKSKFPLSKEGASGEIQIPGQLLSGIYYLKAYTRWMRNYPSGNYAYYQVKVINPFESKLAGESRIKTSSELVPSREIAIGNTISMGTGKSVYGKREKVNVNMLLKKDTTQSDFYFYENSLDEEYYYSISVVKSGLKSSSALYSEWTQTINRENIASYYPEIYGISLSGRVLDQSDKQAVTNANIRLSLLNGQSYYSATKTSEKGQFFFSLPYSEQVHDFYIDTEKEGLRLDIRIDQDFCQRPVALEDIAFSLSADEEILAKGMSISAQLTRKYESSLPGIEVLSPAGDQGSFFGSPNKVYYTKKYIELPNVEEFLFEIMPEVTVSYHNEVPSIHSSKLNSFNNYPFLILIDNIPLTDAATFLRIKTSSIERFDLVDNSYVIGNSKYNGIINAHSMNQDLAGIDLPKNSMFFSYSLFSPTTKNKKQFVQNSRLPDRRMCLYWNPDHILKAGEISEISFYTSDIPGEYEIIIQRISKLDGGLRFFKEQFLVE